jgi:hypothetical protein
MPACVCECDTPTDYDNVVVVARCASTLRICIDQAERDTCTMHRLGDGSDIALASTVSQ